MQLWRHGRRRTTDTRDTRTHAHTHDWTRSRRVRFRRVSAAHSAERGESSQQAGRASARRPAPSALAAARPERRNPRISMLPQTHAAALAPVAVLTFDDLPAALAQRIFTQLPADARLLAAAVTRRWRTLLAERALWARLDLSVPARRVANPTALLRTAASRADGHLAALCVMYDTRQQEMHQEVLSVLAANAGSLRELVLRGPFLWSPNDLTALLRAAPGLLDAPAGERPELRCRRRIFARAAQGRALCATQLDCGASHVRRGNGPARPCGQPRSASPHGNDDLSWCVAAG